MISRQHFLKNLVHGKLDEEPKRGQLSDEDLYYRVMERGFDPASLTRAQMLQLIAEDPSE
ncbi:MAG: hypothetical protein ACOCWZ_10710 [Spirochaetota bacterium]